MSRRQVNPARQYADGGHARFSNPLHQKSRSSPFLAIGLVLVGALLLLGYSYSGSGGFGGDKALSKVEAQDALPEIGPSNNLIFLSLLLCLEAIVLGLEIMNEESREIDERDVARQLVFEEPQRFEAGKSDLCPPYLVGGDPDGGDFSCSSELQRAIPILRKAYGDSMRKVLHVGPDTCSVVSKLLKEEDTEAWGVEPFDAEDVDGNCKSLIRKGIVRVADIKFPLPYRAKSFNLVIVSDALEYLSPKYLNKTLPDLARVSIDGLVIFAGYPGKQRAKVAELSKFGKPAKLRSASWWIRYFIQSDLEENESASKKFEQTAEKRAYRPSCQIFHLNS
ncbi:hypothetical protein GIB67_020074 [Kingdonia uniflora]|uniref:Uncharacterized protein n=1 Tax=Kingdonia uniflora TaxID=39325 RepID=A0A7J7L2F9_9MAGN|nr:hypothetical protein GIB67_020074 [Kingdonia uniflora]